MRYNAFFISPKGGIVPVPERHIVALIKEPELFGTTIGKLRLAYRRHKEQFGFEGHARNEIILDLLTKDWVRLRFFTRAGSWRLQIHEELNDTLKKNILKFCREVDKGNISDFSQRNAPPQIEIHNTLEESLFLGSLTEAIRFCE